MPAYGFPVSREGPITETSANIHSISQKESQIGHRFEVFAKKTRMTFAIEPESIRPISSQYASRAGSRSRGFC
jgi:hypothetical protein